MFIHVRHVRRHKDIKIVHETTHDALLTEHDIRGVYQKQIGTRHIEMNRIKNWGEKGGVKKAAVIKQEMRLALQSFFSFEDSIVVSDHVRSTLKLHDLRVERRLAVLNKTEQPSCLTIKCTKLTCWWTRIRAILRID